MMKAVEFNVTNEQSVEILFAVGKSYDVHIPSVCHNDCFVDFKGKSF